MRRLLTVPIAAALACLPLLLSSQSASAFTSQAWVPAAVPALSPHLTPTRVTLTTTTCPSPGFCIVAGQSETATGGRYVPLVEVDRSGTWTQDPLPFPSNAATGGSAEGEIWSLSCAGPSSCVAVGYYDTTLPGRAPLVEMLTGTTWTATQAPEPGGADTGVNQYASLNSVACPSPGQCIAVGYYRNTTHRTLGLVETLAGGTWTATAAAEPPNAATGVSQGADLGDVDCPTTTWCTAVGSFIPHTADAYPLIDTLDDGSWTAVSGPVGPRIGDGAKDRATISKVACPSTQWCEAIGGEESITGTGAFLGLLETFSAGTWSALEAAEPSGAWGGGQQNATLNGISCTAPGSCVVVGSYTARARGTADAVLGLIDTLSGTSWTPTTAPLPTTAATEATASAVMRSVVCAGGSGCVAIGSYNDATLHSKALIETLSHGAWAPEVGPEPANGGTDTDGKQAAALYHASCAGGSCALAGFYRSSTGNYEGLLETTGMAPSGYDEIASDGGIFSFTVPFDGSEGGKPLNAPIVTGAFDPLTGGYYEVASDGGIFAFTAPFHGSMGGKPLNAPIVGMASDTRTGGYYEVASDGGIFAFTAPFHGSMGGKPLNEPIVGMAFDPATGGYWLVASDGGLFAFTAPFEGSMGGKPLVAPIVGMTYDTLTGGYYEVATDGGLFAFTAPFHGSMGGKPLNEPIVGMAFDWGTGGYWEVASDGGLFSFTAPFLGSMGGKPLNEPIVTMVIG